MRSNNLSKGLEEDAVSRFKIPQSVIDNNKNRRQIILTNHNRGDNSRLKIKNSKIKSLFKQARQAKGESYLNKDKKSSKESHRCFSSSSKNIERVIFGRVKGQKKMKIDPTVDICINREQQDLSDIIKQFHEPTLLSFSRELENISEEKAKLDASQKTIQYYKK